MDKPQDSYELLDYVLAQMPPLPADRLKSIREDAWSGEPEAGLDWALAIYSDRGDTLPDDLKKLIREVIVINGWKSNDYATEGVLRAVR